MNRQAILESKTVKPVEDLVEWARWVEKAKVSSENVVGDKKTDTIRVSTVFLGLDHGYRNSKPLWFETCLFDLTKPEEVYGTTVYQSRVVERYSTWEEAEVAHQKWVKHFLAKKT